MAARSGLCSSPIVAAETPSNLVAVTAISAAVFFVGDPNETYREWNVESQSLARWPRCTDRSFWWHRPGLAPAGPDFPRKMRLGIVGTRMTASTPGLTPKASSCGT
jgi:hypothetical protein